MGLINRKGAFIFILISLFFIPDAYAYYDHVVISEVATGKEGVTNDEFIELYNPTNSNINLDGWNLTKKASTGTETVLKIFPNILIPSYGYLLIAHSTGYIDIVTPDLTYSSGVVADTDNTILLYNNSNDLIDKVGYGSGAFGYELNFAQNPPTNGSIERKSGKIPYDLEGNGWDTNDNSNDFFMSTTPNPQNSSNAIEKAEHPWLIDTFSNITINEDLEIFTAITNSDLISNWTDMQDLSPNTYEIIFQSNIIVVSCSFFSNNLQCITQANQSGTNTIKFSLNDSSGASIETDFLITISAVNDPPWGLSLNLPLNNSNLSTNSLLLSIYNGTDVENNPLTYYLEVYNDSGLTQIGYVNPLISETSETTNDTTSVLEDGDYYWRALVSDSIINSSFTDARKFTVDTTPPIFALTQTPETVYNNDSVELNATITDMIDVSNVILESNFNGSLINYSSELKKDGNIYSYIIDSGNFSNKQNVSYRWYASDLLGNENKTELNSFVVQNRPINIISPILINFEEDIITTINFSNYVNDPDNDVLTFETSGITPNKVTIDINNDNLTFTPEGNFSGLINFSLIAYDTYRNEAGSIGAAAVTLNISEANDEPWWDTVNINVNEDTGLNNTYNLTNYAWDVEDSSDLLTYNIEDKNESEVNCSSVNNKMLEFTPANNFTGTAICVVSANDTEDITNNTISFVINNVNDAPWIEGIIPPQNKDEDIGVWTFDLTGYEKDIDNSDNELTWSVANVNTNLINIQIENSTDVVIFSTVNDANGINTITFVLDDGELIDSQSILINITSENDAPSAPNLISPEDNDLVVDKIASLNWERSIDVDNDILNYHIYISNSSNISYYTTTSNNETSFSVEDKQEYYWYVKADDGTINVTSLTRNFNTSLDNPPVINSYSPLELDLKIGDNTLQDFNVSASDLDESPRIRWYLDGIINGTENLSSYSIILAPRSSAYNVSVLVSDNNNDVWKEWKLIVSDKPVSEDYDMPALSGDLTNITNFYINDEANGKIDFSGSLDLSDVIDIDNTVKIKKGIVAIDSSKYPELNKPARITLKSLSYNSIPKIYYNNGFTTNADEINNECDFCKLISYSDFPTNNGEVVFEVTHFSSFKVGDSGEKYSLELFKDLDKCENNVKGNLNVEIKDPDNNDDFNFGENIDINVNVKNNNQDDKDVIVEAFLYNIDEDDEEENVEADSIDISKNDKEDFELQIKMPEDYDNKDNYILFVKAYEDGNEDQQCNYDIIDLNLERESHDVIIKEVEIIPKEVDCNGNVQANVKVQNIGTKDEKDLYVKLENSELNISLESSKFDLDDYKGSDEKITERFNFKIPENTQSKDYNLDASVYFSDGSYVKSDSLKVKSCEIIDDEKPVLGLTGETSVVKGIANVHLIITNNNEDIIGDIKMNPIGNWADAIAPQAVSLHNGENNIYLNTKIKEGVTGKYSGLVELNIRNGETKKINLVFDIPEEIKEVKEEVKKDEYKGFLFTIVKFVEERVNYS